jgi:hypothetical protein
VDTIWTVSLEKQFVASLNMLESALQQCPDDLWQTRLLPDSQFPEFSEYWYVLFHCLFWVDLYLTGTEEGFAPPEPFTMSETEAGLMPPRLYTKAELQAYLDHNRQKVRAVLSTITAEQASRLCVFPWGSLPFAELLLDNLRHAQEHAAQLNLYLGQVKDTPARWKVK